MRMRTWIFALLVALVFAANLALVSTRVAQTGEDTVRARLAQAANGLRAQMELVDARLSPRAAAEVPELAEATRSPTDPTQPAVRPDDRALRAAASALAPEPDLLAVVNAQGALVSRRARPVQTIDDLSQLPLARAVLERTPPPTFATYDGVAYRIAAARVPGSSAAVLAGTAADDRLASQLKSQVDADVTLISNGKVVASSLSPAERDRVLRWAAAPGPGYGVLQVVLPGVGNGLSGSLPRGALRYAVRGALVPLDGGMQAAVTVPASPYVGWLARYQAFYLLGLLLFLLFGFIWGLLTPEPQPAAAPHPEPSAIPVRRQPRAKPLRNEEPPLTIEGGRVLAPDPDDVPPMPPPSAADVLWGGPGAETRPPAAEAKSETFEPELPHDAESEPAVVLGRIEPATHPAWGEEHAAATHDESAHAEEPAQAEEIFAEPVEARAEHAVEARAERADGARAEHADSGWAAATVPPSGAAAGTEQTPPYGMPDAWASPTSVEPEPSPAAAAAEPAPEPAAEPPSEAAPEAALAAEPGTGAEADPDEAHWRDVFEQFLALKRQLGEPGRISYEKFAAKLAKNRADLMEKRQCSGVRFSVYEKDGKASIKASAVR
jgi:hypothetical protein